MTAADLIRGATLRRDEWRLCVQPELVTDWEELRAEQAAERGRAAESFSGGGRANKLQEELDVLAEQMEACTVTLVLQALPRREYRALVDEHPPRKDADGNVLPTDARYGVDYDAFYNVLARRSILGARVDEETIEDLDEATVNLLIDEKLTDGQWEELTSRCHRLNRATVDIPFSPAGSPTRRRSTAS